MLLEPVPKLSILKSKVTTTLYVLVFWGLFECLCLFIYFSNFDVLLWFISFCPFFLFHSISLNNIYLSLFVLPLLLPFRSNFLLPPLSSFSRLSSFTPSFSLSFIHCLPPSFLPFFFHLFFLFLYFSYFFFFVSDSVELCANHEVISGAEFFVKSPNLQPQESIFSVQSNTKWFRFDDSNGQNYRISTTYPDEKSYCGAQKAWYMTGKFPSVAQGIVQRYACHGHCDQGNKKNIQVRNCKHFVVYKFPSKLGPNNAYCMEKHLTG